MIPSPADIDSNWEEKPWIPAGIWVVPIDRIVGSYEKPELFYGNFKPVKGIEDPHYQWVLKWCKEFPEENTDYDFIHLYKLLDCYFIGADGNHRISALKSLGRKFLQAEIVEVIIEATDKEELYKTEPPPLTLPTLPFFE